MLYAILGEDVPNSLEKRMAARSDHLQRLTRLRDEGRLLLAGSHPAIDSEDPGPAGFSGGYFAVGFEAGVAGLLFYYNSTSEFCL